MSAIGGCSVEQCRVLCRVRCGSVPLYTTKPAQAQGSRLPAMRHRSLNNFHKNGTITFFQKTAGVENLSFFCFFLPDLRKYAGIRGKVRKN